MVRRDGYDVTKKIVTGKLTLLDTFRGTLITSVAIVASVRIAQLLLKGSRPSGSTGIRLQGGFLKPVP
jgi:hypothetical protein